MIMRGGVRERQRVTQWEVASDSLRKVQRHQADNTHWTM